MIKAKYFKIIHQVHTNSIFDLILSNLSRCEGNGHFLGLSLKDLKTSAFACFGLITSIDGRKEIKWDCVLMMINVDLMADSLVYFCGNCENNLERDRNGRLDSFQIYQIFTFN